MADVPAGAGSTAGCGPPRLWGHELRCQGMKSGRRAHTAQPLPHPLLLRAPRLPLVAEPSTVIRALARAHALGHTHAASCRTCEETTEEVRGAWRSLGAAAVCTPKNQQLALLVAALTGAAGLPHRQTAAAATLAAEQPHANRRRSRPLTLALLCKRLDGTTRGRHVAAGDERVQLWTGRGLCHGQGMGGGR